MLTGLSYKDSFSPGEISAIGERLTQMGAKNVLLTGVAFQPGKTGVALFNCDELWHYSHEKADRSFHGTGDIFASAFVGAYMQGKSIQNAATIAADFTALSIRKTCEDPVHWYGVKFETALPELMQMLELIS